MKTATPFVRPFACFVGGKRMFRRFSIVEYGCVIYFCRKENRQVAVQVFEDENKSVIEEIEIN
jgi:hypothetical protein